MLNWLVGRTTPTSVSDRFITTFSGDPQSGGVENIASLNGSANRINMTVAMGSAASAGAIASTADIEFTTVGSGSIGSATVDHVGVMDAVTGGNVMASAAVVAKNMTANDTLKILAGYLTFEIL